MQPLWVATPPSSSWWFLWFFVFVACGSTISPLHSAAAAGPATANDDDDNNCLIIPGVNTMLQHINTTIFTPRKFDPLRRYVTANHKTGTFFAQCLCGVVEAEHGDEAHCAAGGYHGFMGMQHTHGLGITTDSFSVNLVRNPFVMVHSGVEYHSSTTNKHEGWLFKRAKHMNFGVGKALALYDAWCKPGKMDVKDVQKQPHSYQNILQVSE